MTLADLLASAAVLGLTMSASLALLEQGQRAYGFGAARVESQQAGRVALARLAADLRSAGQGTHGDAIVVAERERVSLLRDVDGDGHVERVTWRLAAGVLRRDAGAGGQPVIGGVVAFGLDYLDASGGPALTPGAVRAVAVALTTRAERTRGPGRAGGFTVATHVRLRNR